MSDMANLWVPVDIRLIAKLPSGRAFSEVEAMVSIQVDQFRDRSATIAGYAKLWMWSPGKVRRFLKISGVKIEYPEDTRGKQNQRGKIVATTPDRDELDNEPFSFTDLKGSQDTTDRSQTDNSTLSDRSKVTTNKTKKEKNEKEKREPTSTPEGNDMRFGRFWAKYPRKVQKMQAKEVWDDLSVDDQLLEEMVATLMWQVKQEDWTKDGGRFIPSPQNWLIGRRWEDEPTEVFKPVVRKPWHGAR